jgi:hypothetical protein
MAREVEHKRTREASDGHSDGDRMDGISEKGAGQHIAERLLFCEWRRNVSQRVRDCVESDSSFEAVNSAQHR